MGELLRHWSFGTVLFLRPRLGRDEDAAASAAEPAAQGLRLATTASRVAVWHAGSLWGLPRAVLQCADRRISPIGLITLEAKRTGKLLAGNPHEQFDVAGVGNGLTGAPRLPPTLPTAPTCIVVVVEGRSDKRLTHKNPDTPPTGGRTRPLSVSDSLPDHTRSDLRPRGGPHKPPTRLLGETSHSVTPDDAPHAGLEARITPDALSWATRCVYDPWVASPCC